MREQFRLLVAFRNVGQSDVFEDVPIWLRDNRIRHHYFTLPPYGRMRASISLMSNLMNRAPLR